MEIKENSVELWGEEFKKRCDNQLSEESAELLVILLLCSEEVDNSRGIIEELDKGESYASVMYKRITYSNLSYTITPSGLMFLESIVDNFGKSTMICAFLQYMSKLLGISNFTVDILAQKVFQGIPSEKDWDELWEMQKVPNLVPDNMLDYKDSYKSLL